MGLGRFFFSVLGGWWRWIWGALPEEDTASALSGFVVVAGAGEDLLLGWDRAGDAPIMLGTKLWAFAFRRWGVAPQPGASALVGVASAAAGAGAGVATSAEDIVAEATSSARKILCVEVFFKQGSL